MKISHLKHVNKPNSIVVRNYNNESIVHVPQVTENSVKSENELGQWKIKYKNEVPKEYAKNIVFESLN